MHAIAPPPMLARSAAPKHGIARKSLVCAPCRRIRHRVRAWESLLVSPQRDAFAAVFAASGSIALVKLFDYLAISGLMHQKLSRKLVHILAGPGFMLTWPLFSDSLMAPWIAACVPGVNALRLILVGLGLWEQEGMVKSVSRSGDRSELLRGPLFYVAILMAVTVLSWRSDPTGIMVMAMMCGGDGAADIVGRALGQVKLPWSASKSYAGSLAMWVGGAALGWGHRDTLGMPAMQLLNAPADVAATGVTVDRDVFMRTALDGICWAANHQLLSYFHYFNYVQASPLSQLPAILAISALCTVVESLPINQTIDDNLSVPLAAAIMGYIIFPQAAAWSTLGT